ncbi:hypothetical protein E1178_17240 [Roseibium hamelinense]|nr:hypothetical protein [Roseibium hamelinense]
MLYSDINIDKPQLRRAWAIIDRHFQDLGLNLVRGSDFDEIERLAKQNALEGLEGNFAPRFQSFTNHQATWLGLFDVNDRLVGRVCARFDVMAPPMTLLDFWAKHVERCYVTLDGASVKLSPRQPRFAKNITGNVVYLGGTEVHRDWQGRKIGGLLNRMAQIEVLDDWDAHFVYGWMESWKFKDGFWRDCGFTRAYTHGLNWASGGPALLDDNLIVAANTADDVLDLIDRVVDAQSPL